jgi:hypothetical protein
MTRDSSLALIDQLVDDLAPVKPVPPLWQSVAAILAAGAVVAVTVLLTPGMRLGVWQDMAGDAGYLGVLLGLAVIGVAGCAAGLASAIPGRRTTVAISGAVVLVGITLAVAASTVLSTWSAAVSRSSTAVDVECIGWALVFSVVPIGVGLGLTRHTWAARPALTAGLTLLGASALGAGVVHLCCPLLDGRHLLLAHCSTPFLVAALGGVTLAGWMRRWAR